MSEYSDMGSRGVLGVVDVLVLVFHMLPCMHRESRARL